MKELTYLHCQCFSFSNIVSNYHNYLKMHPGMPTIFVVLDNPIEDKQISIQTMQKLQMRDVETFPIIISDCEDSETRQFFTEFVGGNEQ